MIANLIIVKLIIVDMCACALECVCVSVRLEENHLFPFQKEAKNTSCACILVH